MQEHLLNCLINLDIMSYLMGTFRMFLSQKGGMKEHFVLEIALDIRIACFNFSVNDWYAKKVYHAGNFCRLTLRNTYVKKVSWYLQ